MWLRMMLMTPILAGMSMHPARVKTAAMTILVTPRRVLKATRVSLTVRAHNVFPVASDGACA